MREALFSVRGRCLNLSMISSFQRTLESALRGSKPARQAYEALSNSAKRAVLYPLYSAKREETRTKRLADALAALENGN